MGIHSKWIFFAVIFASACRGASHSHEGMRGLAAGDLDRAIEQYSLAIEADPKNPAHFVNRGT